MRILVLSPQPFFSPRGTPLSVYYRTLILSELGHQIDLLTYGQGEDVDLPGVRTIRIPYFRWFGPVPVGPSLLKLFLDCFLALWLLGLLVKNRYDAIDAHEESAFQCLLFRPFFRFNLIYDMHSSLPQQLKNFRYTRSRIVIGLFERLEKKSLSTADAVISISPALAEYAKSFMPDPEKHFLIENSIHEEVRLKVPVDHRPLVECWREQIPDGRTLISYAGTFEPYQGLDLLLSAFAQVRRARADAFLVLVGGDEHQVELSKTLARELEIDQHCLFTGSQPHLVARSLMDQSHVLASPRKVGTNTPLKVYELLASGKPIVATRIVAHTQVLSDEVCYLARPDPDQFAQALVDAIENRRVTADKIRAARELYENHYSRDRYLEKMKALIRSLE